MVMEPITLDFPRLDPLKKPNMKAVFHEGFCASLKHMLIREQGWRTLTLRPADCCSYERGGSGRWVPSAGLGSPENPRNCFSFCPLNSDVCCISIACITPLCLRLSCGNLLDTAFQDGS